MPYTVSICVRLFGNKNNMYPYITVFERTIPTYGLCMTCGILLCFLSMRVYTRSHGIRYQEEGAYDLAFIWGVIGAIVGAKILYLITVLPSFLTDLPQLISSPVPFLDTYFKGGFVYYGGFYGVLLSIWIFSKAENLPIGQLIYALLPGGILAHSIGRVGCFMEGCCYGRPTQSRIGVIFTKSSIAPDNVPLIPVQLIEAGGEFLLFIIVLMMIRKGTKAQRILSFYMIAYGCMRFALEFFRYDSYRGFIGPLSLSQLISIITVILGIGISFHGNDLSFKT